MNNKAVSGEMGAAAVYDLSIGTRRVKTTESTTKTSGEKFLIVFATIFMVLIFPISIWFCVKSVNEFKRIIIFRLGRLKNAKPEGPGFIFVLPFVDEYKLVDLRTISFDIPPREILTYDAVSVVVDAVVYYRVFDPVGAITQIEDYKYATEKLAQAGLRSIVGRKTLEDFTSKKEEVAYALTVFLDIITDEWGLKIERVEIQEVRLPESMRRALAAEAEAVREAKAKLINAEGELNASCSLTKASEIMSKNPTALQLRYLQALTSVANELNHTILFPFPTEILKKL